jgi:PPOX class probable F420-dependent enzyme
VADVASDRPRIAMSSSEMSRFLEEGLTAVLVTLAADGSPEPVPMWYVVHPDGALMMRTYAASQKVVNMRRDPRVAVLVETGARYAELRGVRLSGDVELVADASTIVDVWTGLAMKYEGLAAEHEESFRAAARERAGKQVALRLKPSRAVSWDHRKLG